MQYLTHLSPQRTLDRTRFFCCLLGAALSFSSMAQEAIYRCGQEYTNAPLNPMHCERLALQAVTVIAGTRPMAVLPNPPALARALPAAELVAPVDWRAKPEPPRPANGQQNDRDEQARAIVSQELDKARQQLALLTQEYNQGEPEKWASEARNHQKYLDRVAALQSAMARTERDIDSLMRELNRRPVSAKTSAP